MGGRLHPRQSRRSKYLHHWRQYRLEAGTAQKRRLYTQVTWWLGGFYNGTVDQLVWTGAWNPTALVTVEFTGERNMGRLSAGNFTQTLVGNRVRAFTDLIHDNSRPPQPLNDRMVVSDLVH